jgi:hypothetical protein
MRPPAAAAAGAIAVSFRPLACGRSGGGGMVAEADRPLRPGGGHQCRLGPTYCG